MKKAHRLTALSLLAAAALIIFIAESYIPPIVPLPGIKLGLANIITLITASRFKKKDIFIVLFVRILLGSIFSGTMLSFLYSISGGFCCAVLTALLYPVFKDRLIFVTSIFGAIAHNTAQIITAALLTSEPAVLYYLPALIISAVLTGAFTGLAAYFVLKNKYINYITENNK